jgi:hypothetical protein
MVSMTSSGLIGNISFATARPYSFSVKALHDALTLPDGDYRQLKTAPAPPVHHRQWYKFGYAAPDAPL